MSTTDNTSTMTPAEIAAWVIAGIGLIITIIAGIIFGQEVNSIFGEPAVPLAWVTIGGAILGAGFLPAILLTGIRQLRD